MMFLGVGAFEVGQHQAIRSGRHRRPCPDDFAERFVELGRLRCEEHYRAARLTISRWLDEAGRQRLVELRAAHVRAKRREGMTRREMQAILNRAFPVRDRRPVNPTIARHAANYLRQVRNGGWIISRSPDGNWWVGARKRTAAELVNLAKAKGFEPASLSRLGEASVGSR